MSQVPPPYNRSFSFTDFSTYNPSLQQPGNKIDQELNNIRVSVNQTIDRLSEIQLDDGRLDSTSLNFNAILTGLSPALSLTYATLNSPVFTGSPEAPTPLTSDNSTKIATTEFVKLQDYATQDQLNSIQSSLSNYLTLSGGTLSGTLNVNDGEGSNANVQSSVIYVQQTNAGVGQSNAYGYMWNGGIELGDTAGKWTELTPDHIRFGDGTIQTTAATAGAFLPLAGGSMTGDIIWPAVGTGSDSAIGTFGFGTENVTLGQVAYVEPQAIAITGSNDPDNPTTYLTTVTITKDGIYRSGYENESNFFLSSGGVSCGNQTENGISFTISNGLRFTDGTYQSTAGLPLASATAQTVSGGDTIFTNYVAIRNYLDIQKDDTTSNGILLLTDFGNGEDGIVSRISLDSYKITFPDASQQSTAALPLTGGIVTHSSGYSYELIDRGIVVFDGAISNVIIAGTGITFPNSSVQTTAFPGYTGTTSDYIDGTGQNIAFPPVGDRYFTTSNSTLTCDSGNGKTMTVGTGLSYSRQQDITVSYNNANHMHGTVLTYDPATGVMTFDSNTHSGGGTYSSWEVNVGGVAGAVLPVGGTSGQVLAKTNSTNFATEWISLGSMASETATNYLSKAGNLSGLASTSTARTNLGLGAVSTDAYATTAQAQAGTSTTTVVSPATLLDAKYFQGGRNISQVSWTTATSGTGATSSLSQNRRDINAPTTAIGTAVAYAFLSNATRGNSVTFSFNWAKRIIFGARLNRNVASPDANTMFRFSVGKSSQAGGDLSERGIMVKQTSGGALQLQVHNGTTLASAVTSSFTPVNQQAYDITVVSDGSGNATLFVNDVSVATSTGAPTTAGSINTHQINLTVENTSIITGSPMAYQITDVFFQNNL